MRVGFGDITPLNVPPGAQTAQAPGWLLAGDGNYYWTGKSSPPLNIPVTAGPGIPSNVGWVISPNGTLVWTGPGTQPTVIPGSVMIPPNTVVSNPSASPGIQLHDWTPQPILPDALLPDPLNRTNPLAAPAQWTPNKYDFQIIGRAKKWQWVAANGGLKGCCSIPELGAPIYNEPPWQKMPSNSFEFNPMNGLPVTSFQTEGIFNGLDQVILSIQVPSGYDGIINRFVASTTGVTGYSDFQNDIVWRLKYGIRYAKNLGNINNTFGSFGNAIQTPGVNVIRVISGQTIELIANVPVGSPVVTVGGTINAGVFGWFYPRR
jgi:hypothetical protein